MPNHIITRMELYEEDSQDEIKKLLETVKSEETTFDFNKILPMPKELRGTRSPAEVVPDEEYAAKKKQVEEDNKKNNRNKGFELGLPISVSMSYDWLKEFGANNWYDWAVANWGTKWNAYDILIDTHSNQIEFQTAWSHPYPIIKKLSTLFPNVTFAIAFADEDRGSNLGIYKMANGEILKEVNIENYAKQYLADTIWGGDLHRRALDDDYY